MDFVALDVETSNADCSSICQIGIARFKDGRLNEEWSTLVNPEEEFDPFNVAIHHITKEMVEDSPIFPKLVNKLRPRLEGKVVVCHTPFDRVAVSQACSKYNIGEFECSWLDSSRIARRAWPQFSHRGYGLQNVCEFIGYGFTHHDALEDAKAAAQVLLAAVKETSINLNEWLESVRQPLGGTIAQDGNPKGPLFGETLVFTGALAGLRGDAAKLAAKAGCTVKEGVTDKSTLLVVGNQDTRKLAGYKKSSKQRKAEDLIRKGQEIKILTESDFEKLVRLA
jgi:DNA polymerase III subunit epsilon